MELLTNILNSILGISLICYLVSLIRDIIEKFGIKEIKNKRRFHIIHFILDLVILYINCFLAAIEFLLGENIYLTILICILWIICSVIDYFNIPSK